MTPELVQQTVRSLMTAPGEREQWPVAEFAAAHLRPVGTEFPPNYIPALARVSNDRWHIMQHDRDNGSDILELLLSGMPPMAPHYNSIEDRIYMPRAAQFADDSATWHALFHESAHRLHFRNYGRPLNPAQAEIVADLSGYIARRELGFTVNVPLVRDYLLQWTHEGYNASLDDFRLIANIARDLIETYRSIPA